MNIFVGIIYLWVYLRLKTFLKTKTEETDNFTDYLSRAFGLIGLYFILVIPTTLIFIPYPRIIGFMHWISDAVIYFGISQIIISILILLSSSFYYRFKNIVYIFFIIASIIHFFYHLKPSAEHIIMSDWAVISAVKVPLFINIAPFFLWFLSFLILGIIFLVLSFRVKDRLVKKKSLLLSVAILTFSLSYPLSRVLFFVGLPTLPPMISFIAGAFGLYILTSTSCVLAIYTLLQKKPLKSI
ncbi:MAG: hypothetical protein ABIB72_02010 [Candidatus Falkowbacteria bacterium]